MLVLAALLIGAVVAGVRSSAPQDVVAGALCDIRSAFTQAGDCGGDDVPTYYDGDVSTSDGRDDDGDLLYGPAPSRQGSRVGTSDEDDVDSPDYANAFGYRGTTDPDDVAESLADVRDALDGGFWGVRAGDLDDARDAVVRLNGPEMDALIAGMDGEELTHWIGQMEDGWITSGWSREERRELWDAVAARASKETLDRLAGFTDELEPSFGSVGGAKAKGAKNSPRNTGEYDEVPHELFVLGADPYDIQQGQIGDCWWMASLAAVAQADPGVIEDAITRNANGTYTVRLYDDGEPVDITVTPQMVLVGDSPALVRSDQYLLGDDPDELGYELWPLVMQKALAVHYGDYHAIEGGRTSVGMAIITGRESTSRKPDEVSIQQLASTLADGGAIGVGSLDDGDAKKSPYYQESAGAQLLHSRHAYYVRDVDVANGTVTVANPWGLELAPPVTLPYADYVEQFDSVDINEVS